MIIFIFKNTSKIHTKEKTSLIPEGSAETPRLCLGMD
jgi:hypothetical protein